MPVKIKNTQAMFTLEEIFQFLKPSKENDGKSLLTVLVDSIQQAQEKFEWFAFNHGARTTDFVCELVRGTVNMESFPKVPFNINALATPTSDQLMMSLLVVAFAERLFDAMVESKGAKSNG